MNDFTLKVKRPPIKQLYRFSSFELNEVVIKYLIEF
jgi:hypothetical protein